MRLFGGTDHADCDVVIHDRTWIRPSEKCDREYLRSKCARTLAEFERITCSESESRPLPDLYCWIQFERWTSNLLRNFLVLVVCTLCSEHAIATGVSRSQTGVLRNAHRETPVKCSQCCVSTFLQHLFHAFQATCGILFVLRSCRVEHHGLWRSSFCARGPSSSAAVRGLVIQDINEVEGARQQEEQEDKKDEEVGDEMNGEVEEATHRAHET